MRTTVITNLKLSPLKPKKRQHLVVHQQRKRAEKANLLWNLLKSVTQKGEIVFSDEKIFTVEEKFNPQNNRMLTQHVNHLLPPEASICRGLSCSVKVNTNVYINDILTPALRDTKENFKNEDLLPLTPPTKPKLGA